MANSNLTSPITTHVLDLESGQPARDVVVRLLGQCAGEFYTIAERTTEIDGRVTDLLPPSTIEPGRYQLCFEVGEYFTKLGRAESFFPLVTIEFEVTGERDHYHVPLLLSPFGYSTYRGS